jgi:hypothetical protein
MVEKAQLNLYRARGFDIQRYNLVAAVRAVFLLLCFFLLLFCCL